MFFKVRFEKEVFDVRKKIKNLRLKSQFGLGNGELIFFQKLRADAIEAIFLEQPKFVQGRDITIVRI